MTVGELISHLQSLPQSAQVFRTAEEGSQEWSEGDCLAINTVDTVRIRAYALSNLYGPASDSDVSVVDAVLID